MYIVVWFCDAQCGIQNAELGIVGRYSTIDEARDAMLSRAFLWIWDDCIDDNPDEHGEWSLPEDWSADRWRIQMENRYGSYTRFEILDEEEFSDPNDKIWDGVFQRYEMEQELGQVCRAHLPKELVDLCVSYACRFQRRVEDYHPRRWKSVS